MLGVANDATVSEIRAAYRRAAQRYHPDRNPGAESQFQALATAYRVLRQPALRRALDRDLGLGGNWKPWYGGEDPGTVDPARVLPQEALEQIAIQLAVSHRWSGPRIAARLVTLGCSYRIAWQLAWQARHQVLNEALAQMIRREARDEAAVPPAAAPGMAHVGRPRLVAVPDAAAAHRPYASARASRSGPPGSESRALAEIRPSVWTARIFRLRRILAGISRLLGFEPPRMAREHRKQLRLAYDRRPSRGDGA